MQRSYHEFKSFEQAQNRTAKLSDYKEYHEPASH